MNTVTVSNLKRYYRVHKKEAGLLNSIKSLIKRDYKTVEAVDDISFSIKEGELVGFIGPNGAGKTTTLKCLSGLLYPTSGEVNVLNYDPWNRKDAFLKQIALVMGQKNQLWWDLPPTETFLLNKEIYEISDEEYKKSLDELVKLLDVKDILDVQVRKMSLGQRMKCELIAALLHSPKVLFLDEPTIGLDVVMQKKVREFIKIYNKRHKATILLTSHYMSDVKELCDRVIIIDKGNIVFDGKLTEIVQRYADHKLIKINLSEQVEEEKLAKIAEIKEYDYPTVILKVKRSVSSLAAAELLKNFPIADLNIEEVAIEDIIREVFTGEDEA